jgi:hypothetical protein
MMGMHLKAHQMKLAPFARAGDWSIPSVVRMKNELP